MSSAALRTAHMAVAPYTCLTEKLGTFVALDTHEIALLERFEQSSRMFGRRKIIRRQGEESTDLFVLRAGWVFSFAIMPDGGRQILDLHFPGDIVGLSSIAFSKSANGIATATQAELCPFPKSMISDVALRAPRLSTLLDAINKVETVILIDRLKSIGRMEARDRVAHFLLQILSRLKVSSPSLRSTFLLPLSQELIGDALGLSSIHVNRTLRRLEEEGHISRNGQEVTLTDSNKLAESVDFSNRFNQVKTEWLPPEARLR